MKKRRICITTGTRADFGFLRPIIKKIISNPNLDLILIVTGIHLSKKHGYTIKEIEKNGFKISARIKMVPKEDTLFSMSKTLGEGIISFSKIFKKFNPTINVILGDRDEMLTSALAASHMNIPNAHIHGGDISGGIDEYNRHAITKLSNIHFAASKKSRDGILKMGENPKFVFLTGSPGIDDIVNNDVSTKEELEKKYSLQLTGEEILFVQHPVTTQIKKSEKQILNTLRAIAKLKVLTIAISPNSDAGNKQIFKHLRNFSKKYSFIKMYLTLPRKDYLGFLKTCNLLIGNSSSGLIEASYFKIPVVNIGNRQQKREHGTYVINTSDESEHSISIGIKKGLSLRKKKSFINKFIYGHGNASKKIVSHLEKIKIDRELIEKSINY